MPIIDSNDVNLTRFDFNENANGNVRNVEFGAGLGFFGKKNYPNCYATCLEYPLNVSHFSELEDYDETSNCHYIDFLCDFYNYDFGEKKFETIIICNPYGYGISGITQGKEFFDRVGSLLIDQGSLIVVTQHSNSNFNLRKVKRFFTNNEIELKSNYNFIYNFYNAEQIDEQFSNVRQAVFRSCSGIEINPTELFEFTKVQ